MSTQYDTIQGPYDHIRKNSISIIERENVHSTIAPFIADARVLELVCGSGFYTYPLLEWGASAVVGVDISPVMIEAARRVGRATGATGGQKSVDFILADCAKPTLYPGGPFDLVIAAWLLDRAPDRKGLVDMFRNVALNLKDGGHFVSVTCPPAMDPTASVEAVFKARPPPGGSGGLVMRKTHDVKDGIYFHCHADTVVGDVNFDGWHLRRDVYEGAAREAGLKGKLTWGVTSVSDRWLKGGAVEGGASLEELKSYVSVPDYGLLVIAK